MNRRMAGAIVFLLAQFFAPGAAPAKSHCNLPYTEIYKKVSPSVVFISSVGVSPFKMKDRLDEGIGSGFIIDKKGLLLTNSHVVFRRGAISVTLDSGESAPAKLLGADPILDLALLRITKLPKGLRVLKMGDSDVLEVGEEVAAIGNPLGLEQTMTRGIVSGLNRFVPDSPLSRFLPFIQTDAPINLGNSGGPLVNRCGEIIGINTAVFSEAENMGFSIPSNIAKRIVPQLLKHGRVIRPWHGINGKVITKKMYSLLKFPSVYGFMVESVEPGSPAELLGLRGGKLPVRIGGDEFLLGGDIITKVNGVPLDDPLNLAAIVGSLAVGDTMELEFFRDGKIQKIEMNLPERPILLGDLLSEDRDSSLRRGGRSPFFRLIP